MANKLYEESSISDIADAIREKNGSSNTYTVAQMGNAVRAIPSGGGSGDYGRIVIGTSTAGHTAADCDYLCDGVNDEVEINLALADDPTEIHFLAGTYNCSASVQINQRTYCAIDCRNKTVLFTGEGVDLDHVAPLSEIVFVDNASRRTLFTGGSLSFNSLCIRGNSENGCVGNGIVSDSRYGIINNCWFDYLGVCVQTSSSGAKLTTVVQNCEFGYLGGMFTFTSRSAAPVGIKLRSAFVHNNVFKGGVGIETGGSVAYTISDNLFIIGCIGINDVSDGVAANNAIGGRIITGNRFALPLTSEVGAADTAEMVAYLKSHYEAAIETDCGLKMSINNNNFMTNSYARSLYDSDGTTLNGIVVNAMTAVYSEAFCCVGNNFQGICSAIPVDATNPPSRYVIANNVEFDPAVDWAV